MHIGLLLSLVLFPLFPHVYRQSVRRLQKALPRHAPCVAAQHPLVDWATIRRQHSTKLKVADRVAPRAAETPPIAIPSRPSVNDAPPQNIVADRVATPEAGRQEPKGDASEKVGCRMIENTAEPYRSHTGSY